MEDVQFLFVPVILNFFFPSYMNRQRKYCVVHLTHKLSDILTLSFSSQIYWISKSFVVFCF